MMQSLIPYRETDAASEKCKMSIFTENDQEFQKEFCYLYMGMYSKVLPENKYLIFDKLFKWRVWQHVFTGQMPYSFQELEQHNRSLINYF